MYSPGLTRFIRGAERFVARMTLFSMVLEGVCEGYFGFGVLTTLSRRTRASTLEYFSSGLGPGPRLFGFFCPANLWFLCLAGLLCFLCLAGFRWLACFRESQLLALRAQTFRDSLTVNFGHIVVVRGIIASNSRTATRVLMGCSAKLYYKSTKNHVFSGNSVIPETDRTCQPVGKYSAIAKYGN